MSFQSYVTNSNVTSIVRLMILKAPLRSGSSLSDNWTTLRFLCDTDDPKGKNLSELVSLYKQATYFQCVSMIAYIHLQHHCFDCKKPSWNCFYRYAINVTLHISWLIMSLNSKSDQFLYSLFTKVFRGKDITEFSVVLTKFFGWWNM